MLFITESNQIKSVTVQEHNVCPLEYKPSPGQAPVAEKVLLSFPYFGKSINMTIKTLHSKG